MGSDETRSKAKIINYPGKPDVEKGKSLAVAIGNDVRHAVNKVKHTVKAHVTNKELTSDHLIRNIPHKKYGIDNLVVQRNHYDPHHINHGDYEPPSISSTWTYIDAWGSMHYVEKLIGQRRPMRLPGERQIVQKIDQATQRIDEGTQTIGETTDKVTKEIGSKLKDIGNVVEHNIEHLEQLDFYLHDHGKMMRSVCLCAVAGVTLYALCKCMHVN